MTILEKVAYLKGLMEGLKLEQNDTAKVLSSIVDILDGMAMTVADMENGINELDEYISEIDEDLEAVEDYLEDEDDDCDCDCDEDAYYTIVCPTCGEEFCVDDDIAEEGMINCPNCGEELEFDLSDLDDECSCDHCHCDEEK